MHARVNCELIARRNPARAFSLLYKCINVKQGKVSRKKELRGGGFSGGNFEKIYYQAGAVKCGGSLGIFFFFFIQVQQSVYIDLRNCKMAPEINGQM